MLHEKGKKNIEEIKTDFKSERFDEGKLTGIFKAMKLTESLKEFNGLKQSGYSLKLILSLLLVSVVTGKKTVSSSLPSIFEQVLTAGKDVFYRLKNNGNICWRRILWHLVMKVMLYWDDKSFIPDDFLIHSEKGKKESKPYGASKKELRRKYSKKRVKESASHQRVKELDINKIEMALRVFYSRQGKNGKLYQI